MQQPNALFILVAVVFGAVCVAQAQEPAAAGRWSEDQARQWYRRQGWMVGCNYAPAYAINQLEMWQADTFDIKAIDRELGWAESLGFTTVRVFLHHLLWEQDREGFLRRMDQFLAVADKHHIGAMFVPLDSVWDPYPKAGKQREPKPHVHNSGWVQSPGAEILGNPARHGELEGYIKGVLSRFANDRRVQAWDLLNEPENPNKSSYGDKELPNKAEMSFLLLQKVFAWAREVKPSQPLTSGVWMGTWADEGKLSPMERLQLGQSDVISFHSYSPLEEVKKCVANLQRYNRPILCTEYMARPQGSTFNPVMDWFKKHHVAAYNWGFVSGKSQTIYPWDSWTRTYTAEPPLWFHDIFRPDGAPYIATEVEYIRQVTGAGEKK